MKSSASFSVPANNLLGEKNVGVKAPYAWFNVCSARCLKAQTTIDVGKITCDRYILDKADARTVAVWLNGFYAGRRNDTVVDTKQLERDETRVAQYCMSHRDMVVMQAFEAMAE